MQLDALLQMGRAIGGWLLSMLRVVGERVVGKRERVIIMTSNRLLFVTSNELKRDVAMSARGRGEVSLIPQSNPAPKLPEPKTGERVISHQPRHHV